MSLRELQDPYYFSCQEILSLIFTRIPALTSSQRDVLTHIFQENNLSGRVLLEEPDLTFELLRADVGIRSFGVRSQLRVLVKDLRMTSQQYQAVLLERQNAAVAAATRQLLPATYSSDRIVRLIVLPDEDSLFT